MPSPPAPLPAASHRQPLPTHHLRGQEVPPTFDTLFRDVRLAVARVLQLPPESRAREEPLLISLAGRALGRYGNPDRAALPPPLKQIDAFAQVSNRPESLTQYLDARRNELGLDDEGDDRDGIGEPSPDDDRDSDEDAIGSEHPKSPSLGPTGSPAGAHPPFPRSSFSSFSSPWHAKRTPGNTTVSSPEPRSTVSAPPHRHSERKSANTSNGVVRPFCHALLARRVILSPRKNLTFTGDDRCTNCIMRNNPTCVVNSSRQRCDSCFAKRHRCSKVLTPPTRPTRDKSASTKGKAAADADESASTRAPKRKRTNTEDDTKRTESVKRPARPTRPAAAASAAGASASASAPVQRPPMQKKPAMQNGNAATSASAAGNLSLAALAASASRAPRAPTGAAHTQARSGHQYYQEKLQVISGILGMVQNAVKELQDQVTADMASGAR
ncbi:hypothetical protein L227DRAFT_136706 [Lentinus tigrinus ALCF2SS1-6]|uniref:Uncharacterized protein n=1 Tax=Lentinus tigrinus ALCF2SS1-6 TaxID=1328759 RepID=A0A5C2SS71_9APHY|nr:hypothetical protein L227DRAFT_136706 [Lentinus tigrinus ALCF2SS1-6]